MMITKTCSHKYLLTVDACLLKLLDHVIAFKNQLSAKLTYFVLYHALLYLVPKLGCLRVHSKYSLACHWLFNWPGMEEQEYGEEFVGDEHAN